MESCFMAYLKTKFKIHLTRHKTLISNHIYNTDKITKNMF